MLELERLACEACRLRAWALAPRILPTCFCIRALYWAGVSSIIYVSVVNV